jgi:hypothetical protein
LSALIELGSHVGIRLTTVSHNYFFLFSQIPLCDSSPDPPVDSNNKLGEWNVGQGSGQQRPSQQQISYGQRTSVAFVGAEEVNGRGEEI